VFLNGQETYLESWVVVTDMSIWWTEIK